MGYLPPRHRRRRASRHLRRPRPRGVEPTAFGGRARRPRAPPGNLRQPDRRAEAADPAANRDAINPPVRCFARTPMTGGFEGHRSRPSTPRRPASGARVRPDHRRGIIDPLGFSKVRGMRLTVTRGGPRASTRLYRRSGCGQGEGSEIRQIPSPDPAVEPPNRPRRKVRTVGPSDPVSVPTNFVVDSRWR